jgi:protein gp37
MNKTKIEWADYRWNPVVGCKYDCWYCYAKRMNHRFKNIPDFNQPQFIEKRLQEPYKFKKPGRIFVVTMGDLFGEWVPCEWINSVLSVVFDIPHTANGLISLTPCYATAF